MFVFHSVTLKNKIVSYGLLDILQKAFQCDYRIFTLTNDINKSLPSDR
jgi:hypothetical protein